MSGARAYANQALYLSRIVLGAWAEQRGAQTLPAETLRQAFMPAVCAHLRDAYGWFLLELAGSDSVPEGGPPRCSDDLPPIPTGKAESGELREVRRLEREGYLAELLAVAPVLPSASAPSRDAQRLAAKPLDGPDFDDISRWIDAFGEMCDRMRNSLDEY